MLGQGGLVLVLVSRVLRLVEADAVGRARGEGLRVRCRCRCGWWEPTCFLRRRGRRGRDKIHDARGIGRAAEVHQLELSEQRLRSSLDRGPGRIKELVMEGDGIAGEAARTSASLRPPRALSYSMYMSPKLHTIDKTLTPFAARAPTNNSPSS